MENSNQNFTWVQTHNELVQYLKTKEDSQEELVEVLRSVGINGLHDEVASGKRIDLKEIDPFTFFCFIHKHRADEKRLSVLSDVAEQLGLSIPEGVYGIPTAQGIQAMLFQYSYQRSKEDISRLWKFFRKALDNSVEESLFSEVLDQYGIGFVKVTEILFYIDPETYFPINGPSKPYLKEVLNINPEYSSWKEYLSILSQIKNKKSIPFYELSYEAWAWSDEKNKKDKKVQAFKELVDRYKQYLEEDGIEKEKYKWEAIQHFQDTFDLDANDFAANLRGAISKANNLVYVNSLGYIRKAVEYFPEDVRKMFRELYDQAEPLEERYNTFVEGAESLLPRVIEKYGKKLNHQQDERTISFYLTMMYPDRYPLYKNETYKYLLSVLGNKQPKSAGEKFFHYLELAKQLIPAVEGDGDVIDMVEELLTEDSYQGEQKWVVFQDILWINMRSIDKVQYWLFQGNPKIFDVKRALEEGKLTTWRVNAHKSKITPGDKVILWSSGDQRGCYALAEVDSEVFENTLNEDEAAYYTESVDNESYNQVQLRITHNLANNPITEDQVNSEEKLSELNIGNQGTNFAATQEEYETLVELAEGAGDDMWNKLVEVVSKIDDEDAVRKFFATVKHVLKKFNLSFDDEITYASAINRYVQFTIGSRYVTHLERKKGKVSQGFYVDNEHLEELKAKLPSLNISDKAAPMEEGEMTWVFMNAEDVKIEDFFEGIDSLAKKGIEGQSKSQFRSIHPDKHNPWIAKVALDNDLLDNLLKGEKMAGEKKQPEIPDSLNTIFYGPPGTGKTYKLRTEYAPHFTQGEKLKTKIEFEVEIIESLSWWEVAAMVLLEKDRLTVPEIKDHRFIKIKENISNTKSVHATLWGQLQTHTSPDSKNVNTSNRQEPFIFEKKEGSVWTVNMENCRQKTPYLLEHLDKMENYTSEFNETQNYRFTTFHQSFTYEDFVEGIKPVLHEESDEANDGELGYRIEKGIFYQAADEACKLAGFLGLQDCLNHTNEERKKKFSEAAPYALFIDEINRGNISAILGELLTLIEKDKRLTKENELIVRLPYSKSKFAVPPNLYILGTLNTADRSVEALDTALRRRFSFLEIEPKPELLTGVFVEDIDIQVMFDQINLRIEKLLDRDHRIGHSYFLPLKEKPSRDLLKVIFADRIIPLLKEYFFGDFGKIGLVLGSTFIDEVQSDSGAIFAEFPGYEDVASEYDERKVFKISSMENWDFNGIYIPKTETE